MAKGTIMAADISGSLDAKNLVMGVLTSAAEISNLNQICPTVSVPELVGTIPVQSVPTVTRDVREWEETDIIDGAFSGIAFDLKKDRVLLAVSDEAQYKSRAGDPLVLQQNAAALSLASGLDYKIVKALETNPQTSATAAIWSTVTNNPLRDLAYAASMLNPYKADFVVMPPAVWAAFCGNNFTAQMMQGVPASDRSKAITRIPGLELDVYVNSNVTAKSCMVGSSQAPPAVIGQGPVKVRKVDLPQGGLVYQIDNWRQVKAPIVKTAAGVTNLGVYQTTAVIA